jgi:hypothetical protein
MGKQPEANSLAAVLPLIFYSNRSEPISKRFGKYSFMMLKPRNVL